MKRFTIRAPLHMCQEWLASMGGKVPELIHLPVIGRKGEPSINFFASFFQSKGSEIRGVRLYEPGFGASMETAVPSLNDMMLWATAMWYTLPLNGEIEPGVVFKQSWTNGRWADWARRGEDVSPVSPEQYDQEPLPEKANLDQVKASFEAMKLHSEMPKSIVLMVMGTKPGVTEELSEWLSEQGVKVRGVRFDQMAFSMWLQGRAPSQETQNQWTSFVWDNLPFNAEMSPGYKYKLVWENRAWRDWTPADDAAPKYLSYDLRDWADDLAGYVDATARVGESGAVKWLQDHFKTKYRDHDDRTYKLKRLVWAMVWYGENRTLFDRDNVSVVGEDKVMIGRPLIEALYRLFSRIPDAMIDQEPSSEAVEKAIQESIASEEHRKKSEVQ